MTFKLQAQAGSRRRSCGVTPRTISGMPSSTERDEWGACTSFGRVLKAADITSVRPGSAQCGIAQPCLTLSGQWIDNSSPALPIVISGRLDGSGASFRAVSLRKPAIEKVLQHRPRQNKGAAPLTKAPSAFRKIGEAVMASEPDACAGVGSPPAGNANHHRLQCASGH
jgi:hypothetical protein